MRQSKRPAALSLPLPIYFRMGNRRVAGKGCPNSSTVVAAADTARLVISVECYEGSGTSLGKARQARGCALSYTSINWRMEACVYFCVVARDWWPSNS